MPQLELRVVERGQRSTLYTSVDGTLYRFYHDTERWHGPIYPTIDEHGCARCHNNRTVASIVAQAYSPSEFRGVQVRKAPPHLHRALETLIQNEPQSIEEFAAACRVATSTAWCYMGKVVEHWPKSVEYAKQVVAPFLWEIVRPGARGSLRELVSEYELEDVPEWKCLEDRFAHLRLARLCLDAQTR